MKTERAIELLNRISDSQFDGPHGDERREALSMAVRALEQNLVQESGDLVQDLVKDCISRQQAIDALTRKSTQLHGLHWGDHPEAPNIESGVLSSIEIIRELPSAQPERQVELDGTESNIEILSELRAQFNCLDEVEEPCYRALSDAICALSAQPEPSQVARDICTILENEQDMRVILKNSQPERKRVTLNELP